MLLYEGLTAKIIAAFYEVSNELGVGFLESAYEKALLIALQEKGLKAVAQVPLNVYFRGEEVGLFFADILVDDKVVLELKAVNSLLPEHKAPVIMKATGIEVGSLVNFGKPQVEYRRFNNKISPLSLLSL